MDRIQIGLIVFICIATVIFVLACRKLFQERREKRDRLKQIEEDRQQRELARKREQAAKPKVVRDDFFTTYVGINREGVEHIQLIQLRTNTESPEEVLSDALEFYEGIVNIYHPGAQLYFRESPDTDDLILLRFRPLEKVGKKIES